MVANWKIESIQGPVENPAAPVGYNTVAVRLRDVTNSAPDAIVWYNYDAAAPLELDPVLCYLQVTLGYLPNDFGGAAPLACPE